MRNNGNGTFTDVTAETGMGGDGPRFSAVGSDFNNDRAVDFVVAGKNAQVLLNPREGKFPALEGAPQIQDAVGVAVLDFNKDGWMDLAFTHSAAPGLTLWRNVDGKKLEQVSLPDLHWTRAWGIAPIDYDNDGYIDLVAVGENASGKAEIKLLRNLGTKGFADVTAEVGLDKLSLSDPSAVVVADYDGDGAADLLITQKNGSPVLLRNEGGTANNSLRLALKGLNDNKSGIGTKVEVFAGGQSQKFELTGAGYLGQSNVDIIAGLGKAKQADVVRMLWPSGVIQDEIEVASNKPASILELDRRGSSCPVLFAWNGERYQFITDMIGAGVVGHWVGPNQRDVPDPTEYVKVDGSIAKIRNGKLSFRFMEPMEEVVYVDQLRLVAVDHPANYAVNSNEAFLSNPPYPEFKVISSRAGDVRPVAGAWDNEGRDVAPQLAKVDHQFVNDLHVLQFAGFTDPHTLTLDLGEPYKGGTLRLLLQWIRGVFLRDVTLCGASGGARSGFAVYRSAGCERQMGARARRYGFPGGIAAHDGCGSERQVADRHDARAHRNESADLLGSDPGGSHGGCGSDQDERSSAGDGAHGLPRISARRDREESGRPLVRV